GLCEGSQVETEGLHDVDTSKVITGSERPQLGARKWGLVGEQRVGSQKAVEDRVGQVEQARVQLLHAPDLANDINVVHPLVAHEVVRVSDRALLQTPLNDFAEITVV